MRGARRGEVFPSSASALCFCGDDVPRTLRHVSGLVGGSSLPRLAMTTLDRFLGYIQVTMLLNDAECGWCKVKI